MTNQALSSVLLRSQPPSPSLWEPTLPIYFEEGRVKVGLVFRSMVFMHGFRRVLPRHGWTSASLSIEELEELLAPPDTVVIAWHLTVRDCLLRSNLPRANLLEASLAAKEPQPKGLMSGP